MDNRLPGIDDRYSSTATARPHPSRCFQASDGIFGWNVIKEASKLNEVLASKVITFVDQLIESDEWHFAPGLHLLIGTYTT